jgi:hypothetical protein
MSTSTFIKWEYENIVLNIRKMYFIIISVLSSSMIKSRTFGGLKLFSSIGLLSCLFMSEAFCELCWMMAEKLRLMCYIEILQNSDDSCLSPGTKFQEPCVQAMNTLQHEVPETWFGDLFHLKKS